VKLASPTAFPCTTALIAVIDIVSLSSGAKVIRVKAGRIIAAMQHLDTRLDYHPSFKHEGQPMRVILLPENLNGAVSMFVLAALPNLAAPSLTGAQFSIG